MKKIKVLSIFGTRPEAIKMAPIIKEMEKCEYINQEVCVSAQHRKMLDQVLEIFDITPDYDLNIMTQNQTLTEITVNVLKGLEKILEKSNPDIILVHGDTTTTFVASLSAFYSKIKIGHVEAGLRTYNKYEPFPEEINRKLTGAIADIHFSPTSVSKNNLLKENVNINTIFVTGNSSIDCLKTTIEENYKFTYTPLNKIDFENKRIITVTAHRRENLGLPLENICKAILELTEKNEDLEVIYAVHFNPLVRKTVNNILSNNKKIHLIDPIDMKDMHNLISKSYLIMTDSGGLQEEVPALNKPVLVLRNVTERPEGVETGALKLAGTEIKTIVTLADELLKNETEYKKMANSKNPFGDGFAAERIVNAILYYFGILKETPKDFN